MIEANPWGNELVDYTRLFDEFGMQKATEEMRKRHSKFAGFRRGIIFAHRDFDKFAKAADDGKPVAVMTGIKPSSAFHLGSKLTADEMIYLQKELGAKAYYCIADLEAYADNGLSFEKSHEVAIDNISDMLALGLDEKHAVIYKQSTNTKVMRLSHLFAKHTTMAAMEALYGHQNLGLYLSVLTQAADILSPMLDDGIKHVVVPVGADQDPHIRFARDIANKLSAERTVMPPSATYHRLMRSLNGETKMSKRDPASVITLNDSEKEVEKKVKNALTGGRETAEIQRRLGGEIGKCVVYELMLYHFYENDGDLKEMRADCTSGKMLCGECKLTRLAKIKEFLKEHQRKKAAKKAKAGKLAESA
ncbi:MAG: tryptophan--tRNA ligase [Candidatus Micrarchaeota archaeon]